jgi:tetratricopeptide (TPR) repeat protein
MDLHAAFERALQLDQQNDIAGAVTCLDEVAHAIPDSLEPLKFAGRLYQRLGADAQSYALLTRALALAPQDADVQLSLGYHHVDNGAPEKALIHFHQHLALKPNSLDGQIYLGRTLDWLGRTDEALPVLQRAVKLDAASIEARLQLGRVQIRLGRLGAADQTFASVLRLDSSNVLAEIGRRRIRALEEPRWKPQVHPPVSTIVCVKAGTKYGADYVNRLASMVQRNSSTPLHFVCFTDDPRGLDASVEPQPLPAQGLQGWWNKVALFQETLPGVSGRVLYLDLDVVITGWIDPLLNMQGDFIVRDNDYVPGFTSSVMLFEVGARPEIWRDFTPETAQRIAGDQDWIALTAPDAELWPEKWCAMYRLRAAQALPPDAKLVVFSGRPVPADLPAPWVAEYWK